MFVSDWRPIPLSKRERRFKKASDKFDLLLDEVQDTAPQQWGIAHSLTEEFFTPLYLLSAVFIGLGDLGQRRAHGPAW